MRVVEMGDIVGPEVARKLYVCKLVAILGTPTYNTTMESAYITRMGLKYGMSEKKTGGTREDVRPIHVRTGGCFPQHRTGFPRVAARRALAAGPCTQDHRETAWWLEF